jgi:hypothetical protein
MDPEILAKLPEGALGQLRAQRDADSDGYISRAEFLAPGRIAIHP